MVVVVVVRVVVIVAVVVVHFWFLGREGALEPCYHQCRICRNPDLRQRPEVVCYMGKLQHCRQAHLSHPVLRRRGLLSAAGRKTVARRQVARLSRRVCLQ